MNNLHEILAILEDQAHIQRISDRIEYARNSFNLMTSDVKSHSEFNQEISRFIQHVYSRGLLVSKVVSSKGALSEAINLLDQYYGNQGGDGYNEAYLDAVSTTGKGIEFVLQALAEIISQREIGRYINWLFASIIDPTDKETHEVTIEGIIKKFGSLLPEEIVTGNPVRFVKNYRDLIETIISTNNLLKQIETSSIIISNS